MNFIYSYVNAVVWIVGILLAIYEFSASCSWRELNSDQRRYAGTFLLVGIPVWAWMWVSVSRQ